MSGMKPLARLLEVLAVAASVLLVLYFIGWSQGRFADYRDGEAKAGLHAIQVQVERYSVDHDNTVPLFLTGGEARWSAQVEVNHRRAPFAGTVDCPDMPALTDPLLRAGYLTAYPRNPFARHGVGVHQAQLTLPLNAPGGDPLRNGVETGRRYGTRFGANCSRMGQLLAAMYNSVVTPEIAAGAKPTSITGAQLVRYTPPGLPPGADTGYRCWGPWPGQPAGNPLPGQFIYTVAGPDILVSSSDGSQTRGAVQAPQALEVYDYSLALFGRSGRKGQDILNATGCPWKLMKSIEPDSQHCWLYSCNPDGVADGIIMTCY
jgi:hypothetical protein